MSVNVRRSSSRTAHRRYRGKAIRQMSAMNRHLSRKVDIHRVMNEYPVIQIQNGAAVNIDYTNPQHLKWLED